MNRAFVSLLLLLWCASAVSSCTSERPPTDAATDVEDQFDADAPDASEPALDAVFIDLVAEAGEEPDACGQTMCKAPSECWRHDRCLPSQPSLIFVCTSTYLATWGTCCSCTACTFESKACPSGTTCAIPKGALDAACLAPADAPR